MRILVGLVFIAFFLIRMIYRAAIKRDLRQNPDELYIGLAFVAVWAAIYGLIYI